MAVHKELGRRAAIKVLLEDVLQNTDAVLRFINEAKITSSLVHPNVIQVLDYGAETGLPWIAYEFAPGMSVAESLQAGPLPIDEAIAIALQVAAGLASAHAKGILHRDIKPANVLELELGHFKVTDFGIAKWTHQGAVHTATGLILGTPAYISPELIEGAEASVQSDVYALGVMLFEILTGQVPFYDENPMFMLERHLRSPIPSARTLRPEVTPALDAIIAKALAKPLESRFASVSDMQRELQRITLPSSEPSAKKARIPSFQKAAADAGLPPTRVSVRPTHETKDVASPVVNARRSRRWEFQMAALGAGLTIIPGLILLWAAFNPTPTRTTVAPSAAGVPKTRAPEAPRPRIALPRPPTAAPTVGRKERNHAEAKRLVPFLARPFTSLPSSDKTPVFELVLPPPSTAGTSLLVALAPREGNATVTLVVNGSSPLPAVAPLRSEGGPTIFRLEKSLQAGLNTIRVEAVSSTGKRLAVPGLTIDPRGLPSRVANPQERAASLTGELARLKRVSEEAFSNNKWDVCIAACKNILAAIPSHLETRARLGEALHRAGRLPEAITELGRCVAQGPWQMWPWSDLAGTLRDAHRLNEAHRLCLYALWLDPTVAWNWRCLARIELASGWPELALDHFNLTIQGLAASIDLGLEVEEAALAVATEAHRPPAGRAVRPYPRM